MSTSLFCSSLDASEETTYNELVGDALVQGKPSCVVELGSLTVRAVEVEELLNHQAQLSEVVLEVSSSELNSNEKDEGSTTSVELDNVVCSLVVGVLEEIS